MRTLIARLMTTIVVGLMVVARASGPGPSLLLTPRPPHPGRDLERRGGR
jgi:hypothetical protein